jgi:hypothetical protein
MKIAFGVVKRDNSSTAGNFYENELEHPIKLTPLIRLKKSTCHRRPMGYRPLLRGQTPAVKGYGQDGRRVNAASWGIRQLNTAIGLPGWPVLPSSELSRAPTAPEKTLKVYMDLHVITPLTRQYIISI